MPSQSVENYLKAIFTVGDYGKEPVTTNALAAYLETKAGSVTDMLKKLAEKQLVNYQKYKGVQLTPKGREVAVTTIRKHRLWEVFLVEHLKFGWDEVHEVAEELEHISSIKLIDNLDQFLGNPKKDPHGDPIPDREGHIRPPKDISLIDMEEGSEGIVVGVREHSSSFLQYLESIPLLLGAHVEILRRFEFDDSRLVRVNHKKEVTLSPKVAANLSLHQNDQ